MHLEGGVKMYAQYKGHCINIKKLSATIKETEVLRRRIKKEGFGKVFRVRLYSHVPWVVKKLFFGPCEWQSWCSAIPPHSKCIKIAKAIQENKEFVAKAHHKTSDLYLQMLYCLRAHLRGRLHFQKRKFHKYEIEQWGDLRHRISENRELNKSGEFVVTWNKELQAAFIENIWEDFVEI